MKLFTHYFDWLGNKIAPKQLSPPPNPIEKELYVLDWDQWSRMKMENYYTQQPCPECGRIGCCDENGLTGISCWAKKHPPRESSINYGPKKEG